MDCARACLVQSDAEIRYGSRAVEVVAVATKPLPPRVARAVRPREQIIVLSSRRTKVAKVARIHCMVYSIDPPRRPRHSNKNHEGMQTELDTDNDAKRQELTRIARR